LEGVVVMGCQVIMHMLYAYINSFCMFNVFCCLCMCLHIRIALSASIIKFFLVIQHQINMHHLSGWAELLSTKILMFNHH